MMITYEYSSAIHLYNIYLGCEEIFNNIVENVVDNYTDFISSVRIAHNGVDITLLDVIEQYFYNLR